MKHTRLFTIAACITVLAGCSKELAPENEITGGQQVSQISAFYAEGGSKTVLASDGKSVLWSAGDEINVFYGKAKVKFTALNEEPSNVTIFGSSQSLMFIGAEGSEEYIWGVYPYRDDNAFDGSSVTLTVPSEQTALAGTFASGTFPSVGRSHTTSMGFYNLCGGIMFKVSQTGIQSVTLRGKNNEVIAGKVKVQFNSDGKPVVSQVVSGSSEVTVTAPEGGFQTDTPYYISLLPVAFSSGFELRFDKAATAATFSTAASVEVKRSIFAKLENKDAGLEWKSIIDLSAHGTANCYIVSQTCYYKFDATVKGNSAESVGAPVTAELLWESFGTSTAPSKGDVINNSVSLKDGYVLFSTPSTLNNGNAVIAVKDASDNILWSWHIWVCNDFNPSATAQTYKNSAGTMMDRNLGATSATPGDVHAIGLLYQWGRKDPFLSGCQISYSSSSNQQEAASTLSWPSPVSSDSNNGAIAFAVAHPTTFITCNDSNYDWYYTGTSSTDNTRWHSTKTMYDPCPAGWRVPDGGKNGVWAKAFGSSSTYSGGFWDGTNMGMNFGSGNGQSTSHQLGSASTIWYPASGYLYHSGGSLDNVGNYGSYWSCTPGNYYAYFLSFSSRGSVAPVASSRRASGQSVRCLSE